jgi:hypothetical protein
MGVNLGLKLKRHQKIIVRITPRVGLCLDLDRSPIPLRLDLKYVDPFGFRRIQTD